jgi:hypothetical protein
MWAAASRRGASVQILTVPADLFSAARYRSNEDTSAANGPASSGSAQAVAVGQVSSLKKVVQLLILPVGFGRFFPRWEMARKRTFIAESTPGNDPRRRATARNPAYIDGEPELRQLQ